MALLHAAPSVAAPRQEIAVTFHTRIVRHPSANVGGGIIGVLERRSIRVTGIVQGVGFRPFVHALASRLGLAGFVVNHAGRVEIEIEGEPEVLAVFARDLSASCPPLARVQAIDMRPAPVRGENGFKIITSRVESGSAVFVSPDAATCDACLQELFDPSDRRYRYPFINCTACGPRLTIVTGSPYDRERTTMAAFAMCGDCRAEYEDPADRRFHAEPIACFICGPRLTAVAADGRRALPGDPIESCADAIVRGEIAAIKGLGGFHLGCDASNAAAVSELRTRKRRDEKPFAVMVPDLGHADALGYVSVDDAAHLQSSARPIVLVRRRPGSLTRVVEAVAPGGEWVGLMLPYTPVHHLVMHALRGRPLVLTSGNVSDEPIAIDNQDAAARLGKIADLFLIHDRVIHVRCEDSVVRQSPGGPTIIRRSRGYAPAPIALSFACPEPVLAVGGQLKNTFALGRGRGAFLSHHLGDLDDLSAAKAFEHDLTLFEELFEVRPLVVAHDLHPDYASTRLAEARAGATLVPVQHHHAHIASCMAENGLAGPVLGVAWDGAGWGTDGCVWGGEFLLGGYREVTRAAHFRYVRLPGGDRAAREPWRMLLAHVADAEIDSDGLLPAGVARPTQITVMRMIGSGLNAPLTSSVGRLFDAVAALCGGPAASTFEGQSAMWLEALAERSDDDRPYPFGWEGSAPMVLDTRPLIRAAVTDRRGGLSTAAIARRFHVTLMQITTEFAGQIRRSTGIRTVALSGGVFLNQVLAEGMQQALARDGFEVYRHRLVPPGDGGLCLGQLAVAAARTGAAQGS
jgi:hydrogenase maturation protein HypF